MGLQPKYSDLILNLLVALAVSLVVNFSYVLLLIVDQKSDGQQRPAKASVIARGEEGINGLTLSNAMFLSSWLNETVTLPLDEELFYAELKKRIDSSKAKKESQDTVVFNVEGTFGS